MNYTNYRRRYKLIIAVFISLSMLFVGSNDLEELEQALNAKSGVYVTLSTELQQASKLPDSQTVVQFHMVDTNTGTEVTVRF